jgi:hypothetical protein
VPADSSSLSRQRHSLSPVTVGLTDFYQRIDLQYIDSGTTNVVFKKKRCRCYLLTPYTYYPGTYGIGCVDIGGLKAEIALRFISQNNETFVLVIPTTELNVRQFDFTPNICQTLVNADDRFDMPVIGARWSIC